MLRIADQRHRLLPRGARGGDIAGAILRFPRKTLAHRMKRDLPAEFFQRRTFAGLPFALYELHDADLHAIAKRTKDQPEGGGRLPLSLAGVDDEEALLDGLRRDDLVARRLLPPHLLGVPGIDLVFAHPVRLHRSYPVRMSSCPDLIRASIPEQG